MLKKSSIGILLFAFMGVAFADTSYTWTVGVSATANRSPITLNPVSSAACSTQEDICWA
ncbi:MAG: hypothetical protein JSR33_00820 [Proteobacteria bacterium]|nr:hypothetical protein [Pseudomonadota bacterium]